MAVDPRVDHFHQGGGRRDHPEVAGPGEREPPGRRRGLPRRPMARRVVPGTRTRTESDTAGTYASPHRRREVADVRQAPGTRPPDAGPARAGDRHAGDRPPARRRMRGLRPGPTRPRRPRLRPRLGRDRLHQPGRSARPRRLLQRAPRPRRLPAGRTGRGPDVLDRGPAGLSRRAVRRRALRVAARVASAAARPGARARRRPVRRAVDHPALRVAGDAQPLERVRGSGRRRLPAARGPRPYRPGGTRGAGRRRGAGRPDAPAGRGVARAAAGRRGPDRPPVAPPRPVRGPRRGPVRGMRGVGGRGVRPLRRPDRQAAPGQRHRGRPRPALLRRRPDPCAGRPHTVPPVRRAVAAPGGLGLVVRAPRAGRGRRRHGLARPPGERVAAAADRRIPRRALPVHRGLRGPPVPAARVRPAGDPGRRVPVPAGPRQRRPAAPADGRPRRPRPVRPPGRPGRRPAHRGGRQPAGARALRRHGRPPARERRTAALRAVRGLGRPARLLHRLRIPPDGGRGPEHHGARARGGRRTPAGRRARRPRRPRARLRPALAFRRTRTGVRLRRVPRVHPPIALGQRGADRGVRGTQYLNARCSTSARSPASGGRPGRGRATGNPGLRHRGRRRLRHRAACERRRQRTGRPSHRPGLRPRRPSGRGAAGVPTHTYPLHRAMGPDCE
ncbi:hypothetical protein SBRY_10957 [Actinacidiphila bryophytorum]|uniref:Uncharacterized protein n=1 Tax=Actinacidiphila bryophytorum TaxID=1436133 RepID=A0A9W4E2R4_9ACTN|nr:hypothetical protein SBRY_10957 [Actinacidiphila bryophytorum]